MDNTKQPFGRELSSQEIAFVSGAGPISDAMDDLIDAVGKLNELYEAAISETTDMMCTATGNC
ncbi:MAG: hypothetical protein HWE13_12175 [Gammaproteobacteria bacterium]|nr:hypothetical protein [Gammaproteobacteria bacterium]